MKGYTVGIDFGTLSGRAVLMDAQSGEILGSAVMAYPHGVLSDMLPDGTVLPVHTALQHPEDYLGVLRTVVREVLKKANARAEDVLGIGFDFTACTMLPLNERMMPLCMDDGYAHEPNAYVKLWKHHASEPDAQKITEIARRRGEPFLARYGGKISSEWMIPKILQILRESPQIYEKTYRFSEAADWIFWLLTEKEIYSAPFAGFKALWNEEEGYPSPDFFEAVDPRMKNLIGTKLSEKITPICRTGFSLSRSGAELVGLPEGTPVAVPLLDAHASMPALGVTKEGLLMLILGTSAVHMANAREMHSVSGICGSVRDGVIPGFVSYEAGQACCGDHFDWFVKNALPASYKEDAEKQGMNPHRYLREKAKKLSAGESGLLCLDWFNGNRSVLCDSDLRGMILGLTLNTKPEEIYRALIEATAYGTRMILENFEKNGIPTGQIIASGGIAEKDEMMMQIYADVMGCPITVSDATMSASVGSAMYAAVAAGCYETIEAASEQLAKKTGRTYTPIESNVAIYDRLYEEYKALHDYFGRGENNVMKRLSAIGKEAKGRKYDN